MALARGQVVVVMIGGLVPRSTSGIDTRDGVKPGEQGPGKCKVRCPSGGGGASGVGGEERGGSRARVGWFQGVDSGRLN